MLAANYDYIWRGIPYVSYPMTFPATSNMHNLNYVIDTISWSRVQPSLLEEVRRTERAVVGRGSWVMGSKSWVVGRGLLIGRDLH